MWSLRQAQVAIIVAGCMGMAYTQLTTSAVVIQFARSLGATGLHIGILGALPTGMLFMQFVAAFFANRIRYRRPLWALACYAQRVCYLPIALGAWFLPSVSPTVWLWSFLAVTVVEQALAHFSTPLWMSWMGDYLPHEGLNQYWGTRHRWQQYTAAACMLGCTVFFYNGSSQMIAAFAIIMTVASVLGVADIVMFRKVDEPPVTPSKAIGFWESFVAPLKLPSFRSYIGFMSYWHLASMVGAPFISLYLLQYVGMGLWQVLALWTAAWVGGAAFSQFLGKQAELHGNKAVMKICVLLKPINMFCLMLAPRDPALAFWTLVPMFMLDAVLNAGILIANNGFLLKNSPTENRTMYIASGTAIAGIVGGVTAIVSGMALSAMDGWSLTIAGAQITGFHVLFLVSMLLRFGAVPFVNRIQEPTTHPPMPVFSAQVVVVTVRVYRSIQGSIRILRPDQAQRPARPPRHPLPNKSTQAAP
ncbi:MAG: MFS transporter [Planctomycetota bacterium]|nr:MAG: MFS transporter [Planctomycetota bacterium]